MQKDLKKARGKTSHRKTNENQRTKPLKVMRQSLFSFARLKQMQLSQLEGKAYN